MSTPEELLLYARLRRDVGASDSVLTDEMAAILFEESLEFYPDDTSKRIAYTRVLALRGIRASAALLGKYAQNQHQEDLSKVFDNIGKLLEYWELEVAKVADPLEEGIAPFFFGVAVGRRGL